jgi:glycosyltransferase involved in cell wall biosynthesis
MDTENLQKELAPVSVIIPNWNHAAYLQQRIESVLEQTYKNFELIILDDCSTDNSREIIERYREDIRVSHIVYNEINSGSPFKQWQKGIDLAKGDYIWIAESDDYADERFLEKLIPPFRNNPGTGIVFCGSYWIDDKNNIGNDLSVYHEDFISDGKNEIKRAMVKFNSIQNVSSVLFKTEILKNNSGKYMNYKSSGDWILYTELLLNCNVCYLSDKLNYLRFYHNNISNKAARNGLWSYEGVDVLSLIRSKVDFTNEELKGILNDWKQRIFPLRKSIPFSARKYFIIHWKLFRFSPINYFKVFI